MARQSAIVAPSSVRHSGFDISATSPPKLPAKSWPTTCRIGLELCVRGIAPIGIRSVGTQCSPCASCTSFLSAATSSSLSAHPSCSTRHATGAISAGAPAPRRPPSLLVRGSSPASGPTGTTTTRQSSTARCLSSVFSTSHTHTRPAPAAALRPGERSWSVPLLSISSWWRPMTETDPSPHRCARSPSEKARSRSPSTRYSGQ
mmetsp:Transcript_40142/g.129066  ORF Transcript_40142/g.129066 Transcript_40142/m.129066 type:complete len:203 (+) Transcript_40142:134-742(+)